MIDLSALTPAERRLLPGGRLEGPTPYVIAIMMFVMVVIGAAGLALSHGAQMIASGVEHRFTLQAAGGADRTAALVTRLRKTPGVIAPAPVSEADMRKTLERWLGPDGADADLPLPSMIDLNLKPGTDPQAVERAAKAIDPQAKLVRHAATLGPALGAMRALVWLAWTLVVLIAAATTAAVVLATRGALDTHRSTIEVMHGVGATDHQVARLFQRKISLDAIVGGTVGAVLAAVVLALVVGGGSAWFADLGGGSLLGASDIIMLAALPLLGAILAAVVARRTVLKALGDLL